MKTTSFSARGTVPHRVTLVYSNRDRASAAFLDELSELEEALPDFRLALTMTDDPSWTGETRRIDSQLLRDHLADDQCPQVMMLAVPGTAMWLGVVVPVPVASGCSCNRGCLDGDRPGPSMVHVGDKVVPA